MRFGKHHIARMYLVTLVLLVALAAYGAYASRAFPIALIVAVVSCSLIDVAIGICLKKGRRIPLSALITGMIIGSIAPVTAPLLLVVLASAVAEFTKHFVKIKNRHIINPAVAGLLVALPLFGAGDEWWAAAGLHAYGIVIPVAAVLILAAYEGRRWAAGLAAAVVAAVGTTVVGGVGPVAALVSVNYYFAFLMVADPKTSPNKTSWQFGYGALAAALVLLLVELHVPYPILMGLVMANLVYASVRVWGRSNSGKPKDSESDL